MPGYGSPAEFGTSCLLLSARALRSHSRRPRSRSDPLHQMLQHVLKYGRVQLVMNFLSGPRREYKTGIAQHAKVARNSRPARLESRRQLARGARPVAKQPQNLTAGLVAQSAKDGVRRGL